MVLFKTIVGDLIKDSNIWNEKQNLVVGIFYVLIDIETKRLMPLLNGISKNLKEDTKWCHRTLSTLILAFKI